MNTVTTIVSEWHDLTRATTLWGNRGKIQLEILPGNTSGYIFDLWVKPKYRRKGYATILLNEAEQQAKQFGMKSVRLYWDKEDTPEAILEWYKRKGYEEIGFDSRGHVDLEKQL